MWHVLFSENSDVNETKTKHKAATGSADMAQRRLRLIVAEGGRKVESCDRPRVMNLIGFGSRQAGRQAWCERGEISEQRSRVEACWWSTQRKPLL